MTFIQMPEKQWSKPERWAWQKIRAGRIADFNSSEWRQDTLLKLTSEGGGEKPKLRSDFLKQILLRQPHKSEIPFEGVRIVGAWFFEGVELEYGRLARQLWLENCRFERSAKLAGLQIDGWFSLEGSTFAGQGTGITSVNLNGAKIGGYVKLDGAKIEGKLDMNGLDVSQDLFMRDNATFNDVDFTGAKVGGQLSLNGARVEGKLNMNGLDVALDLLMEKGATFKDVELTGAKVGGQISLDGATFEGKLNMNGLDVAHHLIMRGSKMFKDVDLTTAKVGGQLTLNSTTFDGELNMNSTVVEENVFMRDSKFKGLVILIFGRVGRNLDLSSSELTKLDLSDTRIGGELRLGSNQHSRTWWFKDAKGNDPSLNLRNVHVGALQDRRDRVAEQWEDAWPANLLLNGFTYDRLGGSGDWLAQQDVDFDMQARDVCWYIDWLACDPSYSPQPYEQLAGVFRLAGDPNKANRILYASRRRARREAWRQGQYFRWLGSSILDWTIGYGLGGRYFRALAWVIAFTIIGACLLYFSGQPNAGLAAGLPARLIYSLDQLLPIVEFEKYDKVVLTGAIAYYFYAQKLIGWALGSFLVAGLAGLTQKQ